MKPFDWTPTDMLIDLRGHQPREVSDQADSNPGVGVKFLYKIRSRLINPSLLRPIKLPNEGLGKKVLEVGPGAGRSDDLISEAIGKKSKYTALEANPATLEVYKQRMKESPRNMAFISGEASHLGEHEEVRRRGPFDLVLAKAMVHHLETPQQVDFIKGAAEVLSPGGKLFILNQFLEPEAIEESLDNPLMSALLLSVVKTLARVKKILEVDSDIDPVVLRAHRVEIESRLNFGLASEILARTAWHSLEKIIESSAFRPRIETVLQGELGVHSIDQVMENFFEMYGWIFTQKVNQPENALYNLSSLESFKTLLAPHFSRVRVERKNWTYAITATK